jgi:hypothetical protein
LARAPTIESRLAQLEDLERELWEIRRSLAARLDGVRRGRAVFDASARAQLARLRDLEGLARVERRAVEALVDEARSAIVRRKARPGALPRPGGAATVGVEPSACEFS